jgi:CRP/FNR family cyclic AMP-dependent transcriptional regulator
LDRLIFAEEVRSLLAPYARQRVFAAGEKLWQEGDDAGMLVAIETGHVRIFRGLGARRVVTLYLFGPGAVFGFMPLLDGGPYPASAIALEETTAQVVLREDLQRAFRRDPDLALGLVRLLATRLREAFARIEQASVPEVLPLVATALVSLLPAEATPGKLVVISLPVRASEFAEALGIVPESLSRALTKLVDAGVLHRLAPRRLQVLDPGGLRRAANTTAPRPSSKRATPARSRR